MRLCAPYRLTLALQIRKEKKQTETMREQKKEKRESKKRRNKKTSMEKKNNEREERKRIPLQTGATRDVFFHVFMQRPMTPSHHGSCFSFILVNMPWWPWRSLLAPMVKWGVFIYKSFSDLYVTLVQPRDKNVMRKIIFTWSKYFNIYFAHIKNCSLFFSLFSFKIPRN